MAWRPRLLTETTTIEQKTNDPADLEPPQPGGGLNSKPEYQAFHARGPHVPSPQVANNLPPPKVCLLHSVPEDNI